MPPSIVAFGFFILYGAASKNFANVTFLKAFFLSKKITLRLDEVLKES